MIRAIHHTAVLRRNLERSLAFYRDLLGFEPVMDSDHGITLALDVHRAEGR